MKQTKTKKDRIFIIVMAIIVANLTYMLLQIIPYLVTTDPKNIQAWALVLVNAIGIVGALWLVKEERKRRRKEKEDKFTDEIHK